MKKLLLGLGISAIGLFAYAQNGLEKLIVEKYYVSTAADSLLSAGALPIGSVTYRFYLDMLPGFKFQAVYGVPGHFMRIKTTTLFFNNEDRGTHNPTNIAAKYLKNNTVMLDSWLSTGAAGAGYLGILKKDDNGINTIINADGILKNSDGSFIPLTTQDGMILGTPGSFGATGIDKEITVFDAQNDGTNGPLFETDNGTWYCAEGFSGPTADNRVLIAQITTNGTLTYELNVQIGGPNGITQNFVAKDPVSDEIVLPSLTGSLDINTLLTSVQTLTTNLVKVYPNPTSGSITIQLPVSTQGENSYTIYDIIGNVIVSKDLGQVTDGYNETLDISSLSSGQYIFRLIMDGKCTVEKIIKY